jgi:2'-5' RNA ligase
MPRLFIAADLSEAAKEKLSAISSGLPGADWVPTEQFHLTLRFLGEIEHGLFQEIRQGLGSLQAKSFFLSLRGLGHFPLRGDPEVLWAGVARSEGLLSLRNKVESLVVKRGAPADSRNFFPHVTLARIGNSPAEWIGRYIVEHSLFSVPEIPVQGFSLYSSRLTPEGAIHSLEESYTLEGLLDAE